MLAHTPQERAALLGVREQLHGLHRHQDQREARADGEIPGVCDDGPHGQPACAPPQLGQQNRVEVQRGHLVPAGGQVERDPSGSRPNVEHGARRLSGELAPEGEIGGVSAALHVVPENGLVGRRITLRSLGVHAGSQK